MKEGKKEEAESAKAQVANLKADGKALEEIMEKAQQDMTNELLEIPNIPCDEVPEGKDAADNVVVKEGGEKPNLGPDALCHWDLLKKYNLVDFDLGVKITGAGFPVYIGKMARFQRALEAFFLDEHARADTWKYSHLTLSTRLRVWVLVSCLTRKARCIMPTSTTCSSSLLLRFLSPTSSAM